MHEGLADGREADAPLLRQPTLRRQPITTGEATGDDLLAHQFVDLAVQRHKRAAVHRKGTQPAIAAAVRPDVLVTRYRGRNLLHLPMLPGSRCLGTAIMTVHHKFMTELSPTGYKPGKPGPTARRTPLTSPTPYCAPEPTIESSASGRIASVIFCLPGGPRHGSRTRRAPCGPSA